VTAVVNTNAHSRRHLIEIIIVLVWRNHKARYQNTAMGVVWALVSPTLFLLTFLFLFRAVFDLRIPNYASYTFIGIVAWGWLQASLFEAVGCITSNASLLLQPRFQPAALPVVSVAGNLLNFLLTFPLMAVILAVEGARFSAALLFLPLILSTQFAFSVSAAYFLAALNVTFRDTQYIAPLLLQLAYFATPIFYDSKTLPPEVWQWLQLNPMLHIVQAYRRVLIDGAAPDWLLLAIVLALSLALLGLAYRYFRHSSHRFLEEI